MRRIAASAYVLLALTALFWAGTVIAGRAVADETLPLALNFWRWVVALAVVAPFGWAGLRGRLALVRAHWRLLGVLGLLNMTGFGSLMFVGLQHTQALNASLLLGTMTINVVILSWLVLRVRISAAQTLGVAAGFAGMVVIVARGDPAALVTLSVNIGDPVIWLAILCYGFYSIFLPRVPDELPLASLMTVLCAVGVATCLPLHLWEALARGRSMAPGADALWAIAYLGVFSSLLAQTFWAAGVAKVGANTASYFIYLAPVFGTVMAVGLLGETLAPFHVAGVALIFVGIFLATRRIASGG